MKRGLVLGTFLSLILLIEIVSAQSAFIDAITAGITPQLITLSVLFVVFFAVLDFSTSKIFKGNKSVSVVVSLAISLLIVYWINQSVNVGNLFAGFGISDNNLYTVGSVLLVGLIIFLFIKIKSKTLFVLGGIAIIAALSGLVYETTIVAVIGIILIIIGIVFAVKKKQSPGISSHGSSPAYNNPAYNTYNTTHHHHHYGAELDDIRKDEARAKAAVAEEGNRQRSMLASDEKSLAEELKKLMNEYNNIRARDPGDSKLDSLLQDINSIKSEMNKLRNEKISPGHESEVQSEVAALENKARSDESQALGEERGERSLIATDEASLSNSLKTLIREYNQIQARDPADSRLYTMVQDIQAIKTEMNKLKHAKISRSQESAVQSEVLALENKARGDESQAVQVERKDIQVATQGKEQALNTYKNDYDHFMREYNEIKQEYDQLARYDPRNPRVQKLAEDANKITSEVNRIKAEMDRIERS